MPFLYGRRMVRRDFLDENIFSASVPTTVLVAREGGMGKTRYLINAEAALRDKYSTVTTTYGRALAQYSESNGFSTSSRGAI